MKVYRNPPKPVTVTIEDGKPSTEYDVAVVNNFTTWGATVTSDAFGNLIFDLPQYPFAMFDETYDLSVQEVAAGYTWNDDRTDFVEDLSITHSYLDSDNPLFDPVEEELVRLLIDAITGGFYYTRIPFEGQGLGIDFFALPGMDGMDSAPFSQGGLSEILDVWENNVHVYKKYPEEGEEWTNWKVYELTKDRTAATQTWGERRFEAGNEPRMKHANSDTYRTHHHQSPFFPKNFYYNWLLGGGYKQVPDDILLAAGILWKNYQETGNIGGNVMDDYIKEYSTDQFKLVYGDRSKALGGFGSTGSKPVDIILEKYLNKKPHLRRLGVL